MSNYKVVELFGGYSQDKATIQGEGRFVGVPSVFLRLFGCNFECRSFGMDRGANGSYLKTKEPEKIVALIKSNPDQYTKLDDIPLASTGCDSFISWHKDFKGFSEDLNLDQLVNRIKELVPNGFGSKAHLVITGGEPLLKGQQKKYPELIERLYKECNLKHVTFETNGTQPITNEFAEWVSYLGLPIKFYFSCSVKLECSGEQYKDRIKPDVLQTYLDFLYSNEQPLDDLWFKFVAGDKQAFDEVDSLMINEFRGFGFAQVYIMPIGGTLEELDKFEPFVVQECLNRGYSYSPRAHVRLFANSWGK